MTKAQKEAILAEIADDSLTCIEKVAEQAKAALTSRQPGTASVFASVNTLNNPRQVDRLREAGDENYKAALALRREPVIARIHAIGENDEDYTIFVSRSTPPSIHGFTVASYRAPLGRIASLAAGDEETFHFRQKDRNLLIQEISLQQAVVSHDADEKEAPDAADAQTAAPRVRRVSLQKGRMHLERALKALAKARQNQKYVSQKSQNGRILDWLGPDRIPEEDEIAKLGKLLAEKSRLRKFERLEQLFFRRIPRVYKHFRTQKAKTGHWYKAIPPNSSDIHWQELDLVILATLRIANELLGYYRGRAGSELPSAGPLAYVRYIQRAQVLVDEATDFSRVQLACMNEIAHPSIGSLFLCGDINQRLTSWGIKSNEALDWINKGIVRRTITRSYRQSQQLVNLAQEIATLGGSRADNIAPPEHLDAEGLAPVWHPNLGDPAAVAAWLTKRIHQINRSVEDATTIAVLVNEEDQAEPLERALNARLKDINMSATACKDGHVAGDDRDVRIFNIHHIKGLEFEAVFFIDMDQTVSRYPCLFLNYLYVGATRAAEYLGITFRGEIPRQIEPLFRHFETDWPI
ncbi:MAG: ATP-binding domain-containing protein [Rhodobacteraceae bacterium]|nr:ATP-binding domain-containing protein [Paracoccaceae bacterium]